MAQAGTLRSIQYLRALAALAVVAAHLPWRNLPPGAAGVDVFFIISGFVMMHASRREPGPAAFLRARFMRVVPFYWLMTLAAVPVWYEPTPLRFAASLLFIPTPGVTGWWVPLLNQGWTLDYEMLFYGCFAAVLLLPARQRLSALTAAFLALCVGQAILAPDAFATRGISAAALLEFLAGAWLYRAWQVDCLPGLPASGAMAVIGACAIGLGWHEAAPALRTLAWGVPGLAIVAAALTVECAGCLPASQPLLRLGDASYALYLTHSMVIWAMTPLVRPLPTAAALAVIVAACIGVALAAHRWVEVPMGQALRLRRQGNVTAA